MMVTPRLTPISLRRRAAADQATDMRATVQFVISLIDSRCRSTGKVWMLGTDQPTVIVTSVSSGVGLWFQKNITKGYVS
jgi:hypothetical protein